ncbi:MAG: hypothetical protein ISR55_12490 [Bacteroidetes bacterium]|nr:hypothetical protein [Bacteroidota bacterium]
MKVTIFLFVLFFTFTKLFGQIDTALIEGRISYIGSQHLYVKFPSTEGISIGDTLYLKIDNNLIPALKVSQLSSLSCTAESISTYEFVVNDHVYLKQQKQESHKEDPINSKKSPIIKSDQQVVDSANNSSQQKFKQQINGRLSLSSYSSFSNTPADDFYRMRYTFLFNAKHIHNSKFSLESYISFNHKQNEWGEIKANIYNGLKMYGLSLKYDITDQMKIYLGRKINHKLSSIGAIDGVQFEKSFKSFSFGAFAGSRPDYSDYSVNLNLFQFGSYLSHNHITKNAKIETTFAFIDQKNNSITDRRFAYFQFSNSLYKRFYTFLSVESDLFKIVDSIPQSTFDLSSLYVSFRYKISKKLSLSTTFDVRKNVIYYETYKNFIDKLLETESRQGLSVSLNYRPAKYLSTGMRTSYRFRKDDIHPSRNLNGFVSYTQIPGLKISGTINATFLQTSYLEGQIYSLRLSKDLMKGKLLLGLNYRYVDCIYPFSEQALVQNIADISLSWDIYKRLILSVDYELTAEQKDIHNLVFLNLSKRF